ncbi:hypothetical protein PV327_010477 [Microctonus hyperodae]|uniref:Uncharacterized protein n=1 Tax=Microctonus hyperodae TaxID=165561 RepID=A0AA39FS02_MICHY|nr:hypothetical protein PV327_010477 [Microctonus hyperodae]
MKFGQMPVLYSLSKEETQEWNQAFWSKHNAKFIQERKEFQKNLTADGKSITADEMSIFYKSFLDRNWIIHLTYNILWYKQNIRNLFLEIKIMEDISSSNGVLKSEDIVYTLMKVSRLESPSSSSSNQSTSATNEPINCQTLNSKTDNSSSHIQNPPDKFPVNTAFNIEVKLVKIIIKKLLQLHWNDYIHWKTLLSFGLGLWIALCITDKYYQKEESKLGNKIHFKIIEKTINKNFEEDITRKIISNSDLKCRCAHNFFKSKSLSDEYYHNKFTIEKFKNDRKNYIYDESGPIVSSKNRHVNPVEIIPYDGELHVNSDIFWELKIINSHDNQQINDNTKRNHKHFNTLGIQSNVAANIDRESWNNDCNYNDDNRKNWELNSRKVFAFYFNDDNPIESINHLKKLPVI